ncbi:MHYT domain-containing protein [Candidatus Odyssella thessalonicensis]|uniref:MHYT domain-containing protein n=1 Tax=Candidatus Odyssella thessalonicensis TaxID=84647 RepID=UPI000225C1D1|nr:MHYT domain-containing protein [Candidatus Odyssella thessalonicensis]
MLTLINESQIPYNTIVGQYDTFYILISYFVSVIAAWTALLILQNTNISHTYTRLKGCLLGALVMGAGIWSMHFTGMLAYKIEMEHTYNLGLTILSMIFAAGFSFAVFLNITRQKLTPQVVVINAPVMGIGICVMHYIGMTAMEMKCDILYLRSYFWTSVLIAIMTSGLAMWIMSSVNKATIHKIGLMFVAALILGGAVTGMHYTAMAATVFSPYADCRFTENSDQSTLATAVVIVSLSISLFGFFLVSRGFLKENKSKETVFSFQGSVVLNLIIIMTGATTAFLIYYHSRENYDDALIHFRQAETTKAHHIVRSVRQAFESLYIEMLTISKLPFLNNLADTSASLDQRSIDVMKNIHDNFKVIPQTNLIILTRDHTADDINSTTKQIPGLLLNYKSYAPRLSEEIILKVARHHLAWFKEDCPLKPMDKDSIIPAKMEWINIKALGPSFPSAPDRRVSTPSPTIIYSLPYYGPERVFKGIIVTVFPLNILSSHLQGDSDILIRNQDNKVYIFPSSLPGNLRSSFPWIRKAELDPHFLFSTVQTIDINDKGGTLKLWVGANESEFFQSTAVHNIKNFRNIGYSFSIILTLLALSLFNIMRRSFKFELEKEAEANKAKTEFLSNMSHELRTPMHAILSYSNMGLKKLRDRQEVTSEPLYKYLNNIQIAGNRLLNLLNNLLDLAKLEAGKMDFNFQLNDFQSVIDHSFNELESLFTQKGITLAVDNKAHLTEAVFDKEKLVQVVINLLSNAIKFSSPNSRIHITVANVSLAKGKGLSCRIEDEGIGVPKDEVTKIFDKFFQSSITRTQAGGTGLGLPICKQIMEGHGGTIWAENGSKGAVFMFQFPLNR